MSAESLGSWLQEENFALSMSSGFFAFFAHAGMLSALEESGLKPSKLSGSSAGALISGLYGAGMSCDEICQALVELQRQDFWDPRPGFGLLRGKLFRKKLKELLPVQSFSECRLPIFLSVYDILRRDTFVLSDGDLASAIHASCALPLLFQPVRRGKMLLSDGGIADRPGLLGIREGERGLYHHIASRSPWRKKGSPALKIPKRSNMLSLQIMDLPRANPFRLERGRQAMQAAKEATLRALEISQSNSVVTVHASS